MALHRRRALAALAAGATASTAGCLEDVVETVDGSNDADENAAETVDGPNGADENAAETVDGSNDADETDGPDPDRWAFVGHDPAHAREGYGTLSIRIRNATDEDRTYRDTLRYRGVYDHADPDWTERAVAVDVPAGEVGTVTLERRFVERETRYELAGLGASFTVQGHPHVIAYGDAYANPHGVAMTLSRPERHEPAAVEMRGDDEPGRDEFAALLVHARVENRSDVARELLHPEILQLNPTNEETWAGLGLHPDRWAHPDRDPLPIDHGDGIEAPPGTVAEGWVAFRIGTHRTDVSRLGVDYRGDLVEGRWPIVSWQVDPPALPSE